MDDKDANREGRTGFGKRREMVHRPKFGVLGEVLPFFFPSPRTYDPVFNRTLSLQY
jgi:hypothetical protein